jgi:hypothetical protein
MILILAAPGMHDLAESLSFIVCQFSGKLATLTSSLFIEQKQAG